MAKYRARFNDKARAGAVAKRQAFKSKAQKQFRDADDEDLEKISRIHEMARPESDARKKVRMAIQFPERANAAKKKRLEKYIEKQVSKEERQILLKELAKEHEKVDLSGMKKMSELGQRAERKVHLDTEMSSESSESDEEPVPQPAPQPKRSLQDLSEGSDSSDSSVSDVEMDVSSESEDDLECAKAISSGTQPQQKSKPLTSWTSGFGFTNLPQKPKTKQKSKISWREKLGIPAAQELLDQADSDASSSDGDSEDSDSDSSSADDESSENEADSGGENGEESESDSESGSEASSDEMEDSSDEGLEAISFGDEPSAGKSFAQWAKEMNEEPKDRSELHFDVPENYQHEYRPTISEEAAKTFDKETSRPGYFPRIDLTPELITRSPEIDEIRANLPAVQAEQQVMEAIHHFDVVVITGATGSGKTTQIPQFLVESGYANNGQIGVTQPRRVAAVSMAKRIGQELGIPRQVGYQIRFDSQVNDNTKVKLMTDGVLLKEMSSDLLLSKYSAIVVDEAHERSVNTDILIGLLSRVVMHRREQQNPLKLVIMSATLRVADFVENQTLFKVQPPVVNIEARQFPVTNHFSRRTATDYVDEAVKKVQRIHQRLPKGGILLFLTGKEEIQRAVAELDPFSQKAQQVVNQLDNLEEENVEFGASGEMGFGDEEAGDDDFEKMDEESDLEIDDEDKDEEHDQKKLYVLPLYSLLSTEEQMKVFDKVPSGHRLCVVATNVAETSLTIPGIRYVVDCGRAKQRDYDLTTGVQKYKVKWVSKASADQRAGRAGRTGPGHCYRLFSSAIFETDFPLFGDPEVLRMPIEGLVLQMKAMGLSKIANFPFPTPIPDSSLQKGLKVLQNIGALDPKEEITKLGEQMSLFPLHPRHAKMLLIANQNQCLPLVIALVSTMSVNQVFMEVNNVPQLDGQADVLQLLSAFAAFSYDSTRDLCDNLGLRFKQMLEAKSLRTQLAALVAKFYKPDAVQSTTNMLLKPLGVPNSVQISTIKQIVAASYIDLIAIRQHLVAPNEESAKVGVKQVYRVPYMSSEGPTCYLGPSIMHTAPDLVVYSQLNSTETTIRMAPLTAVTIHQLALLAQGTSLLTYSKPLGGAYAPKQLPNGNRQVFVVPHYQNLAGGFGGFDLPPQKLIQKRVNQKWVNA